MGNKVRVKLLRGECNDRKVGDIFFISSHLANHLPLKFKIIGKKSADEPDATSDNDGKTTDEGNSFLKDIKNTKAYAKSLVHEDEEVNDDGLPVVFLPKKNDDEFLKLPPDTEFPYKYKENSQWYFLSNGAKIMGLKEATRGEKLIQLIYGTKDK